MLSPHRYLGNVPPAVLGVAVIELIIMRPFEHPTLRRDADFQFPVVIRKIKNSGVNRSSVKR